MAYHILIFVLAIIFLFGLGVSCALTIFGDEIISENSIVIVFSCLLLFLILAWIFFDYQKKKYPKKFIRDKDVKDLRRESIHTILTESFKKERMLSKVNTPEEEIKTRLKWIVFGLLALLAVAPIMIYIYFRSPELYEKIIYILRSL